MINQCTLCGSDKLQSKDLQFLECLNCLLLIRVDPLDLEDEKSRYLKHENSLEQEGYREFLQSLWHPTRSFLKPSAHGLDFGSGAVFNMQSLCLADGYVVDSFDPFFSNIKLKCSYDFILLNEVIEHIRELKDTLKYILKKLKAGGVLGIQTSLYNKSIEWDSWYYQRDRTHVSIFQELTIEYLECNFQLTPLLKRKNVFIFRKN